MHDQKLAPFGNPDGSRADIEEILNGFVQFGGTAAWGGLGTKDSDFRVRVIVGRKGTGKTVYLRRLHAYAATQENSFYSDSIQQDLPPTELIVKFSQWFPENILTEKWMLVWRRAIIRSVISHVVNDKKLASRIPKESLETLKSSFGTILRDFRTPVSAYSQVHEMLREEGSSHRVTQLLDDPQWAELEHTLSVCIHDLPPLCFFIDAVDEELAHAPMYWLRCQKGLFYTIMRLLRDSQIGGRLHIVICIRDIVLSSAFRSEHQTRYIGEEHIRILNWNKRAISYFLSERIRKLPDAYFILDPAVEGKTLKSWLGQSEIWNARRQVNENIEDYILRHTRLLPRDIVIMGNYLCGEIAKAKTFNEGKITQESIRETVSKAARAFGNEQLAICGNQILSDSMPPKAAVYGYSDAFTYTGNMEYLSGAGDELRRIISLIGRDRFSKADFVAAKTLGNSLHENGENLASVLWQNGLMGYVESGDAGEKVVFYSEELLDQFGLPDREEYVFHSCLIDCAGIEPVGLPGGIKNGKASEPASIPAKIRKITKVFISYSHKDAVSRAELESHLKLLQRQGEISTWTDRRIEAGEKWGEKIDENLEQADIVILLVSADFIASDYCYDKEMKRALERDAAKAARVIPVIIRDCDWMSAPFGKLQVVPTGAKPVNKWRLRDSAWSDVVQGIRRAISAQQSPPNVTT